jgi:hypothetical protein
MGAVAARMLIALAAVSCARRADPAVSRELQQIFRADQREREQPRADIDWPSLRKRDAARRLRVKELLEGSPILDAEDDYHAAMVFQHGEGTADFELARTLALRAVTLRPAYSEARLLAAQALDRALLFRGLPQKYGTQYKVSDGHAELQPVDPRTTDAERREWAVPTLAEAQRIAGELDEQEAAPEREGSSR